MYTEHYKAFSQNVNFAARILHYYLHMSARANEKADYDALNKTARFWNDFNFMALQTVIIFLGKIFDSQSRTHNLSKLLNALPQSLDHFSKANLKARKIATGGDKNFDWDEYVKDAHELNQADVDLIHAEVGILPSSLCKHTVNTGYRRVFKTPKEGLPSGTAHTPKSEAPGGF